MSLSKYVLILKLHSSKRDVIDLDEDDDAGKFVDKFWNDEHFVKSIFEKMIADKFTILQFPDYKVYAKIYYIRIDTFNTNETINTLKELIPFSKFMQVSCLPGTPDMWFANKEVVSRVRTTTIEKHEIIDL